MRAHRRCLLTSATRSPCLPACLPPQWEDGGGFSHDAVMALYGLQGFEAFRDETTDTRALLAWRDGCILLAFRGTASTTNALTDFKAWKTPVEPQRRHQGRLVKAHAGFWQAYCSSALKPMRDRIAELAAGFAPGAPLRVYLTGACCRGGARQAGWAGSIAHQMC